MADPKIEAWRKKQAEPDSVHYWIMSPDGLWTRGNPKDAPYEVKAGRETSDASRRYWARYGLAEEAPYLEDEP